MRRVNVISFFPIMHSFHFSCTGEDFQQWLLTSGGGQFLPLDTTFAVGILWMPYIRLKKFPPKLAESFLWVFFFLSICLSDAFSSPIVMTISFCSDS